MLFAVRDIEPLELILTDPGTVVGPNYCSEPVCLQCLRTVEVIIAQSSHILSFGQQSIDKQNSPYLECFEQSGYRCTGCGYPVCSAECGAGARHAAECALLSRRPALSTPDPPAPAHLSSAYSVVTPLRLLLARERGGDTWRRTNQVWTKRL